MTLVIVKVSQSTALSTGLHCIWQSTQEYKNGASKICGRQPLRNLNGSALGLLLKNGQTFFKNLTVFTQQDFKICLAIFQYT